MPIQRLTYKKTHTRKTDFGQCRQEDFLSSWPAPWVYGAQLPGPAGVLWRSPHHAEPIPLCASDFIFWSPSLVASVYLRSDLNTPQHLCLLDPTAPLCSFKPTFTTHLRLPPRSPHRQPGGGQVQDPGAVHARVPDGPPDVQEGLRREPPGCARPHGPVQEADGSAWM